MHRRKVFAVPLPAIRVNDYGVKRPDIKRRPALFLDYEGALGGEQYAEHSDQQSSQGESVFNNSIVHSASIRVSWRPIAGKN